MFDLGEVESYKIPRGIVLDRDLSKVHPVDANYPGGNQGVHLSFMV